MSPPPSLSWQQVKKSHGHLFPTTVDKRMEALRVNESSVSPKANSRFDTNAPSKNLTCTNPPPADVESCAFCPPPQSPFCEHLAWYHRVLSLDQPHNIFLDRRQTRFHRPWPERDFLTPPHETYDRPPPCFTTTD